MSCDGESKSTESFGSDSYISREYVYVDTNYGVKCPLKSGLYEKLSSKPTGRHHVMSTSSNEYALPYLVEPTSSSSSTPQPHTADEPCKYLTQTQTLQVGCLNEQQYSLRTRLCYPNQNVASDDDASTDTADKSTASGRRGHKHSTTAYTQLESEINLVCLADWTHEGNHVIVSRTMSNEILCSVPIYSILITSFQLVVYKIFLLSSFLRRIKKINSIFSAL